MKSRYRVRASSATNTYAYCWKAAREALRLTGPQVLGNFYYRMMAGVFAAFTVEAFLNHLGRTCFSDWDVRERKFTPLQKLRFLCKDQAWSMDEGKRPYQTFRKMVQLRNSLAHGKTGEVVSDQVLRKPPREANCWPEPNWKKLCALVTIKRMVEDAEEIVRDLNRQSGSSRDPFMSPGHAWSDVDTVEKV